jgi:transposase-like protein
LRRSKLFPLRLTPGEWTRYQRAARKLGVTVAEILREGADLYIETRGRDGSPKKETQK